jgi:hypothetical protein
MKCFSISAVCVIVLLMQQQSSGAGPKFAPYFDASLEGRTPLTQIASRTGQKDFHLAFAVGSHAGCVPTWGAQFDIDDPAVLTEIKAVQAQGGKMILATGGAMGPYLEHLCPSSEALANAYKVALDAVRTTHLDLDIEATVNLDLMNKAVAQLQRERPEVTVAFTLMVQGEDYGLTPGPLGVDLLKHAKSNGVRVDTVNAMAMEYPKISPDFGDSVINVGISVLGQMKEIWPEKTDAELRKMLGITPMLGRNFNSNKFEPAHGTKLVNWANTNEIGLLAFWSIERDKGCEGALSPYCSGIPQEDLEFTKIFQGFTGRNNTI